MRSGGDMNPMRARTLHSLGGGLDLVNVTWVQLVEFTQPETSWDAEYTRGRAKIRVSFFDHLHTDTRILLI